MALPDIPTSPMTRRILKAYDYATDSQRAEGLQWYADARLFCAEVTRSSLYSLQQVAYVTAALSPQVS
jgi:hypothetical protein